MLKIKNYIIIINLYKINYYKIPNLAIWPSLEPILKFKKLRWVKYGNMEREWPSYPVYT